PFTYELVFYPFNLAFVQKLNIAYVDEWASVDFNDPRGKVVFILLAGIILGALFSRYRWKLHELLLAAFALYAGLKHIRFLFLAAILLAPLLSKMLGEVIPPYRKEIDKPALNAAVMALLLAIVIYRFPAKANLQEAVDTRFPAKAVAYIKENHLSGNFFHRYMWGGYLIFFCRDTKTFIDGRTDIFEYTGVLKDYLDVEQLKSSLAIFDKYHIRYALVPPDFPIAYLLKNRVEWKTIYQDEVAMIFERVPSPAATAPAAVPAGGSH
ncbi:MAG: hypothetical protein HY508_07340, partial [Acidobacteria bacterium]|nr:hypothetical protein [Acidobacteriota bacterium]